MRHLPILFLSPLYLGLLFAAPLAAQASDTILRKDGARLRGLEITEFGFATVKTKKGETASEIPGHMVVGVQWGGMPDAFGAAKAALEHGDFNGAVQLFGEAANQATRPLVKTDCEFFQIKAAVAAIGTDKGAAATAASRAAAWVASNGSHWRVPEALLLAGRAQRLAGNGAEAATTLRTLDERSTTDGFGAVWGARAKYELALALLADNKGGDARAAFQATGSAVDNALATASADAAELRNLKVLAKIGEGETFLVEKQYARAESFFHELEANKEPGIAGAAYAGEGEAIFLPAVESKNAAGLRRAQLAFAAASVHDALSSEASAKANYYLGRCLLELGPDRETDSRARANAYFQLVVNSYPSSRWAGLAKAAIQ